MDKKGRLQRYDGKDYTELVEFPVEIVGRDGVVRRYSFEDSIRLYQRRMSFAAMRYDGDVASAELGHCQARIDQLRRSYFHRFGWGTPTGGIGPEHRHEAVVGELAAFLARVLRASGRLELQFEEVGEGSGAHVWFVQPDAYQAGMLLYVYTFGRQGTDTFFADLQRLRQPDAAGDAEQVIAFHHTDDCGFVLTGRAVEVAAVAAAAPESDGAGLFDPTPWDDVLESIRRSDLPTAFVRCRWIVDEQPWHRDSYVVGAMLAIALGRPAEGEELCFVGLVYLPDAPLLHYYQGLARIHLGRPDEALGSLDRALAGCPGLLAAHGLRVIAAFRAMKAVRVWQVLAATPQPSSSPLGATEDAVQELTSVLRGWGAFFAMLGVALAAALVVVWMRGAVGGPGLAALVLLGCAGGLAGRGRLREAETPLLHEDLQAALQRLRRPHDERDRAS